MKLGLLPLGSVMISCAALFSPPQGCWEENHYDDREEHALESASDRDDGLGTEDPA